VERLRFSSRRTLVVSLSLSAAAALVIIPSAGPASAEPTLSQTQATLDDLGTKLDSTNEQLNDAKVKLQQSKDKQAKLLAQIKPYQARADEYEKRVAAIGAASYQGARPSMLGALITGGSPQDVVDKLGMLNQISRDQKGTITALEEARKPLEATKKQLDTEVAAQAKTQKDLEDKKKALDADFAKWYSLKKKLVASSTTATRASRGGGAGTPIKYAGPATGKARTVVSFAYAQLGKTYVFGAAGPSHYDCSGLTMAAWATVGVSMAHSAHEQYNKFDKVSRANLMPGDLVFFYGGRSHVGIYVGGGKMIHASQPGEPIVETSIDSSYYMRNMNGAVRPG
jgi:cell wall-associated NlpC family hydrolase